MAEKSIQWLQRRVAKVMQTLTTKTGEDGECQLLGEPDDYIHVLHKGLAEAVPKQYPAEWLLQPANTLPDGHYQVLLWDKPEADGGAVLGQHECHLRNRGEGQNSGAYEEQRATALALENIRTSSQDLRDTVERQAQEMARLRDENERLRSEIYELRQGQSGEVNRTETFRFLREMFSQTDDRQATTTATATAATTAATGDAAAKPPDLLPKEGTCPNG